MIKFSKKHEVHQFKANLGNLKFLLRKVNSISSCFFNTSKSKKKKDPLIPSGGITNQIILQFNQPDTFYSII